MAMDYGFDTLQVHAGQVADPVYGARAVPLYQTTAYLFEDAADAAAQFALEKPGCIYTRLGNPTTEVLEKRMAALEGGVGCVCFASGTAAILACVTALCNSGDELISLATLYGGTYTLFHDRMEKSYGIKTHLVDPEDLEGLEGCINDKTRLIYIETLGNPNINIPDLEGISAIAKKYGLPIVADNTFGTPYLIDCKAHGIDFVVHSLTKYVGGHGNSLGGSVTDLGTFDFKGNPRFADFNNPDPSYHGIVYADLGPAGFVTRLRAGVLRDTGAAISPFNAYMLLIGLETLSLRVQKHSDNALAVAKFLSEHPAVTWVHYPALESDKHHDRYQKYFRHGCGGIMTFGIKGGVAEGRKFIDTLKLFSLVANVADAKSLVVHPGSTTHSQLDEEGLKAAGVSADMVRLSIGIEDEKDIIADLAAALEKSQEG
ncbi:MAG: O-acetylhomoserine aminocarboxypropyltransferase/cysteine synthase [Clostridia bacterium]|nr:O-acetylhomoserine aminocarboxypropyltransferase/cysteine synthase [Clostridia bacterium]